MNGITNTARWHMLKKDMLCCFLLLHKLHEVKGSEREFAKNPGRKCDFGW